MRKGLVGLLVWGEASSVRLEVIEGVAVVESWAAENN